MSKVTDFLEQNMVVSLATSAGDKPRCSIMEYVMLDGCMFFATDPDSIKANNLRQNSRVSASVYNMPVFVTVDGAVTAPTQAEIDAYNKVLFERHPEFKDYMTSGVMQPMAYYKLVGETAYYNDYSQGMSPAEIIEL